jgi:hypothetical protein
MPSRRITMRKIKEVLRLRYACGLSFRADCAGAESFQRRCRQILEARDGRWNRWHDGHYPG